MQRVVVTGMGVVGPLGCDVAGFWEAQLAGRSGVSRLDHDGFSKLPTRIGARATGFNPSPYLGAKEARRMSRTSQMALAAAEQAIESARLRDEHVNPLDVGVIVGSSIGGFSASDAYFQKYHREGASSPFTIPISMNVGPASVISIRHGFRGPLLNVDAACASGSHAIGMAYNLIRTGMLRSAVTGGADSPFSPAVVGAWCALRALSERNDDPSGACRPFSLDRDGLVLGEGAGILILESETFARERGAPILAEVAGYGASSDSHHLTQPSQDGPALAMRRALDDAGFRPDDIDLVNAHATATQWNDKNETAAIKAVFGPHAYRIPVVGNKSGLGHSIGASGAIELISSVLSLRDQRVPPTINVCVPDPECDLDYVTEGSRAMPLRHIVSNSFAFGGSNAALIISRAAPDA